MKWIKLKNNLHDNVTQYTHKQEHSQRLMFGWANIEWQSHKLPRGAGDVPPGKFWIPRAWKCNLLPSDTSFCTNLPS